MNKDTRQKELIDLKLDIEKKAAARWNERKEFRTNPKSFLKKNADEKALMKERYDNYNIREAARPLSEIVKAQETKIRTNERKIGDTLDLSKRPPSTEAYKFGKPVGRIFQIPDQGIEIDAFGTGFLITDKLLMTNFHVLPSRSHAEGCAVNFNYEYNEFNKLQSGTKFKLNPAQFFLSDETLDFAIVMVEPLDAVLNTTKLSDLGCIPLIATKGKVVINDPINIVQYPLGHFKQYSTINNVVKDILEEEGFIQYTTDTLESSSGSPAANKFWEVVALHHSGIAMTVDGKVWSRYDKPWDPDTMGDDDKIYVANEGISISRIVDFLKKVKPASKSDSDLIATIIANSYDKILENASGTPPIISNTQKIIDLLPNTTMAQNIFNFYNTATVNIYTSGNDGLALVDTSAQPKPTTPVLEAKLRFDENYSSRRYKGYKANFLGVKIPTPTIEDKRLAEIFCKEGTTDPLVLNYYHYSLVMNKKYRLQMWSAVNVDYDPALKTTRERKEFGDESNSWRLDPRIPAEIQITDPEFYKPATQVDRGHIVRRDDSCYGSTELEIEYANSDTFHWTNCTPQHEGFNQSRQWGEWGLLENTIKDGLSADDTKASIFAGPILEKDPERKYKGIHYPTRFWKVVAALDEGGELAAYGFILDQSEVVDERGLEAKFDFSKFKKQQTRLSKIEQETGVIFPQVLKDADFFVKNNIQSDTIEFESKESIRVKK